MGEEASAGSVVSKIVTAIFILAVVDLAFINWLVLKSNDSVVLNELNTGGTSQVGTGESASSAPTIKVDSPQDQKDENQSLSSDESTSPSPTPKTAKAEYVVVQNQYKEIFIPLGSGSIKSSTFSDLYGVEVTVDTGKYSEIDYVTFEASVWVEGGNGKAWAQLKNVSDNNPLIESQISNSTSTPTLKSSSKIPFASGVKTYRVQAKTDLVEFPAYVDNARLKIVLK